jgi:hypothetical protein
VGTYAFTLGTLDAGSNYTLHLPASPATFAITPKSITVTPDGGQGKVYGAADPVFTYSLAAGALESGDHLSGALDRVAGANVGTYAFTLGTLDAGSNYTLHLPASPATFAITPKPITITPDTGQAKVYGSGDPVLTYSSSPALLGTDSISGVLGRAPGENVGTYAFALGTLDAGGNYSLSLAPGGTFAVTPKPITVTPDAGQGKVYGAADPAFGYSLAPGALESGDHLLGALGRAPGSDVGTYAFTLGSLVAGSNYTLHLPVSPESFAITPRPIAVAADPKTKLFGLADPALTYHVTSGSLAGSDHFSGALTRIAGESVAGSPYAIQQGTLSLNSNYTLDYTGADFTITKAPATLTFNLAALPAKHAGDGSFSVAGYATSGASAVPVTFSSTTASTICSVTAAGTVTIAGVGTCAIRAAQLESANYFSGYVDQSLTITYVWTGFLQPVDNLPKVNSMKAGQAIPVKFALGGNLGLNIFSSGSPASGPYPCGSLGLVDPIEQTVTAGNSSLTFDTSANQYVYVWKTDSSWSGQCRTLTLKLVDGSVHQANFWFTK